MGGFGSGRSWRSGVKTTSGYSQLDVRRLHRKGLLELGQAFTLRWSQDEEMVAFMHILTEEDKLIFLHKDKHNKEHCYGVPLVWTPCNYGGVRPWLLCPAGECSHKVAKLYLVGEIFACRHCYKLVYFSQLQTPEDRAMRQADRIRDRLGWDVGILSGHEDKPKSMHWETFEWLVEKHDALVMKSMKKLLGFIKL